MTTERKSHVLSTRIPEGVYSRLVSHAGVVGASLNTVIVVALRTYLDKQDPGGELAALLAQVREKFRETMERLGG